LSAILADFVTQSLGAHHVHYPVGLMPDFSLLLMGKVILGGMIFGLMARAFIFTVHKLIQYFRRIAYAPIRPFLAGLIILGLSLGLDSTRYLGLGIGVIEESFQSELSVKDSALKLVFTTICLGGGFKGGEVTPLFFIGSTLGNVLGSVFNEPLAMFAALGFVSVFAGAANTPLACLIMAMELFGSSIGVFAALSCMMSYLCSAQSGIYSSQKKGRKYPQH